MRCKCAFLSLNNHLTNTYKLNKLEGGGRGPHRAANNFIRRAAAAARPLSPRHAQNYVRTRRNAMQITRRLKRKAGRLGGAYGKKMVNAG
ncbi:hypothetical protein EVAR_23639_1 [Eumeta japonica]|uniref:Uncharacterized protein n=1 Tax=Eumeta variegata TaxID=151549 RepID=A0A4C1VL25_EUMVA|nr:hypothetical protein EVAR_23639_1 [Eumeta japonica]